MKTGSFIRGSIVLFAALFAWSSAKAQNYPNGFLTSGTTLVYNHDSGTGNASLDGSKLKLTDDLTGESRSVWYADKVNVAKFETEFEFQDTNATADGFTFCIQRHSSAVTGEGGGGLGYTEIPNSVAIKFDIYNPSIQNVSTTGLYVNGATPSDVVPPSIDVKAASGIDFHSGHIIRAAFYYVDDTLIEQITDLTTNAVFTHEYTIDIPATIGAPPGDSTAYVGFTAATGALTSTQELIDWAFVSLPVGVADVLMYRGGYAGTGEYLTETMLSATNVNSADFGKLFSYSVDGQVYAQPLYKAALPIYSGTYRGTPLNTVIVATENDSVYAFDADGTQGSAPLWEISFIDPANGVTAAPADDLGSQSINPEVGITSTPVIDPTTNTVFVCAKTKEVVSGTNHYVQRLHGIDLSTGLEQPGSPVLIADTIATLAGTGTNTKVTSFTYVSGPTISGTGEGSINGKITFNALRQLQRCALTLVNGTVYIAVADAGDIAPYHGWVLGYDADTGQLTTVWNDTPDGGDGGIWESGAGLVSDSNNNLYCLNGNGTFQQPTYDASTGTYINGDYGNAFLKFAVDFVHTSSTNASSNGWGLEVTDYFIPSNEAYLNAHDLDLGSGGALLLPDSVGSAAHPHLMVGAGKGGTIYMVDRDNMGGYNPAGDSIVEELVNGLDASFDTPGYFNGVFYYCGLPVAGKGDNGRSFAITSGSFTASRITPDIYGSPAASPIISGTGPMDPNAVVWCLDGGGGSNQLRAYEASDFNKEIYTTAQAAGGRDLAGAVCKFAVPIVANGRVYVPTASGLVVYGLLNPK